MAEKRMQELKRVVHKLILHLLSVVLIKFLFLAFIDRYSEEMTGKQRERERGGKHAAKCYRSDSNPGWSLSSIWHVVACSTQ